MGNTAALVLDLENIMYELTGRADRESDLDLNLAALTMKAIESMVDAGHAPKIKLAYADFKRVPEATKTLLTALGFDIRSVESGIHKNSADMYLCVDVLRMLPGRQIDALVLVSGDRDFIPLVRELRRNEIAVKVISFRGCLSTALHREVGDAAFLKLDPIVKPNNTRRPGTPALVGTSSSDRLAKALSIVHDRFSGYSEIYMSSFARLLQQKFPHEDHRSIIAALEVAGAIVIEKKRGELRDYAVFRLNWNSELVRQNAS